MAIITPTGISGITSITSTGNTLQFNTATGDNLNVSGLSVSSGTDINVSGIVTATEFVGNITGNVNSSGISTVSQLHVGTGGTIITTTADGNINIDSGGVYYDASNNRLAIGTTAPSTPLNVLSGAGTEGDATALSSEVFRIRRNTASDSGCIQSIIAGTVGTAILAFGDKDSSTIGRVEYDNSTNSLNLWANNSERARIDSSGRVTMPYQPGFWYGSSTYNGTTGKFSSYANVTSGAYGGLNCSAGSYNIGNHFNTSTGVFTAPIGGRYLIKATYANDTGTIERNIGWLYYNNANIGEWVESYGPYDNSTGSLVINMASGDYIEFATHPGIPFTTVTASINLLY